MQLKWISGVRLLYKINVEMDMGMDVDLYAICFVNLEYSGNRLQFIV